MKTLIGMCMALFLAFAPGASAQDAVKIDALRAKAAAGDAEAQRNLGEIYYYGEGVSHDYAEGRKWYILAAKQGNADAQYTLGVMCADGEGGPRDYVEAHKWFNLAAAQGSNKAAEHKREVAAMMTPAQIAKAQKLAREWIAAHPK